MMPEMKEGPPDFSKLLYMKQRECDGKWNIFVTEDGRQLSHLPWLDSEEHVRYYMGLCISTLGHNHWNPDDILSPDEYRSRLCGHKVGGKYEKERAPND